MSAPQPSFHADAEDKPDAKPPVCPDPDILDVEPMVRNFGSLNPTVHMLYAMFMKDEDDLASMLRDRLANSDLQGARLAAHAAAGAARTAGARRVARLFSSIEDAILSGDSAVVHDSVSALDQALADVRSLINQI
ncbi:Hpt domain-containing protein [Azospirillum sp. sgz302134]